MQGMKVLLHFLVLPLVALTLQVCVAHADDSIAQYGAPKYKPGFTHFDYVNPDAPKGGTLKLSSTGSFDSVNPFILKGVAAPGIGNYVFQTLMQPSYDEPQSYYPLIARSLTVAPDRSWVEFTLDPRARFSDGQKGHGGRRAVQLPYAARQGQPGLQGAVQAHRQRDADRAGLGEIHLQREGPARASHHRRLAAGDLPALLRGKCRSTRPRSPRR
ncbi:MAG: hypothetical protein WDN72_11120 [Alphaproteobacteria bacterium]